MLFREGCKRKWCCVSIAKKENNLSLLIFVFVREKHWVYWILGFVNDDVTSFCILNIIIIFVCVLINIVVYLKEKRKKKNKDVCLILVVYV